MFEKILMKAKIVKCFSVLLRLLILIARWHLKNIMGFPLGEARLELS